MIEPAETSSSSRVSRDHFLRALEQERDRLAAENRRLAKLLELRGQDTSPSPEQPTVTSLPGGPVSAMSPNADKVAFYLDLFRARTDTYATRWENARTGRSGWVPAVPGGWRKGTSWAAAPKLRLTPEVVANHLRENEVFVGLYPMRPDNTVGFVAADFDGKTALVDALAYLKAAGASGTPAALEISQSGRGAHVWIFFADLVNAAVARQVGTALMHEATLLSGGLDLRSYDRFFPAQDVLPGSGPGNLIAAPLQGLRKRDGLTLFLDPARLEPYEDQWDFLSRLDRLSTRDADRVARRARSVVVGSVVTALARAQATRVHPRLPAVVRATLAESLRLPLADLSPEAVSTFKHAASTTNPRFYELQRLRRSTFGTPRFVTGYDVTIDDELVLPRGLRHVAAGIINEAGSRLEVLDERKVGAEIEVTFTGNLRIAQVAAVDAMLEHDDGLLLAPPGSGKTVMACAIIAERATSTVVLVDRRALAEQWRARIQEFLGIIPGQLGGGRTRLTGVVDVVMLPTLARRDDVAVLLSGYGHVVVDEAHHVAAAAYDHAIRRLAARYWLGLTATPERRDGLDALVTWQVGSVRHSLDAPEPGTLAEPDAESGPARVLHIHETDLTVSELDDAPSPIAEAQRALGADPERNALIVAEVVAAAGRGRNCLVLTRRVAHLEVLASLLTERELQPMVLRGGMSTTDRRTVVERLAETSPGDGVVVLGTTPFVGEGFDAPALDTLFLAAPISFAGLLVQCAGRVIRPLAGKDVAEVHDFHDPKVPILASSLARRMPGYRRLRFQQPRP
ncbi:TOTE conflict system archaeo-eukaryotic primase domain-containing protein [Salana multivorans]